MGAKKSKINTTLKDKKNIDYDCDIRVLITGNSFAGKSTLIKQMNIVSGSDMLNKDASNWSDVVKQNIFALVQILMQCEALEKVDLEKYEHMWQISKMWSQFESEYLVHTKALQDPQQVSQIVQTARNFAKADADMGEHTLNTLIHAEYFLNSISRISDTNYVPTQGDMLRVRVRTSGITDTIIQNDTLKIKLVELSGGRGGDHRSLRHVFHFDVSKILIYIVNTQADKKTVQENLQEFCDFASKHLGTSTPVLLVANKIDMEGGLDVAAIVSMMSSCTVPFTVMPCSSITGTGVKEILQHVSKLYEQEGKSNTQLAIFFQTKHHTMLLLHTCLLVICSTVVLAQVASSSNTIPTISIVQTAQGTSDRWTKQPNINFGTNFKSQRALEIQRNIVFQSIKGFGGAFTEAASFVYHTMNAANREQILDAYFSPQGLNYSLCRIPMNSCDFSLSTYSCDDKEKDYELKGFSIKRDLMYMIPFMQDAIAHAKKYNPNKVLEFFISPWSPPAWMKSNHNMNGSLTPGLIADPTIYASWALFFAKFISAYKEHGINIWGLTVQNEAMLGNITYEACVYTAPGQREFVKKYLGPIIRREHPHVQIMIYDHNRDFVARWAVAILSDPEAVSYVDGVAFHWYSANGYEHLQSIHELFPNKFLLASEACACPIEFNNWRRGEDYALDIIHDLNNFAVGWIDWNLLLNMKGQPNHVNGSCDAAIIGDAEHQQLIYQSQYYYLGHFSKFLPPGSKRVYSTWVGDQSAQVQATTFIAPNNIMTIVAINTLNEPFAFKLHDAILSKYANITLPAHSIVTMQYPM